MTKFALNSWYYLKSFMAIVFTTKCEKKNSHRPSWSFRKNSSQSVKNRWYFTNFKWIITKCDKKGDSEWPVLQSLRKIYYKLR